MIKSELVQRIASQNPHLYQRDVENIINAILNEVTAAMAARASGLVGSKPLGAAFSGEERIASTLTPTVFRSSVKFGYWNRTPIEPTSEVSSATMCSADIAAM